MALENICRYNKFGHCKYGETCHKQHVKELCEIQSCEAQKCPKRHPRVCKYYYEYRRCKFGSFCSFSHRVSGNSIENENKIIEMERKISNLEKAVAENEDRIKKLKDKLDNVEVESKKSEDDLKHLALQTVGAVSEIIVKKATEAVVEIVSKHQHESVKRNEAALEALCSQLKVLSSSLQSTPLSTLNSPFQPISTTSIPSSSSSSSS